MNQSLSMEYYSSESWFAGDGASCGGIYTKSNSKVPDCGNCHYGVHLKLALFSLSFLKQDFVSSLDLSNASAGFFVILS